MSTGTTEDRAARHAVRVWRGPLHGATWLVWRQHRWAARLLAVFVLLAAAGAVVLRARMAGYIDSHHIAGCSEISRLPACAGTQEAVTAFRAAYGPLIGTITDVMVLLPAAAGMFAGAPLIARELENGTAKLAWTQSVSPVRWFAAKCAVPLVLVLAAVSALSALVTWCLAPAVDEVSGAYWYSTGTFNALGPVPVAYCLLSVVIGVLAGLVLRRTVPAMAVTVLLTGLLAYAFDAVRPHLMATVTTRAASDGTDASELPDDSWYQGGGLRTESGERLPAGSCSAGDGYADCLRLHKVVGGYVDSHPAAHRWPLAWLESALVTGAAAVTAVVLALVAARVLRRR
ncbi:ABC transporter permease [Streptomyces sp. NPDC018019]|uniref:ABC transporter permease n=1 Tax=Streptomyces sp. NPDC018019 TaxID=3365030 RepID=UPI0037BDCA27